MRGTVPWITIDCPRPSAARHALPRGVALFAAVWLASASASSATIHSVTQRHRAFPVCEISIAVGDSIAFGNDDEFLHQIYIGAMNFDSAEQRPGETIIVTFPRPGRFVVRCHIHPKMLLIVNAK